MARTSTFVHYTQSMRRYRHYPTSRPLSLLFKTSRNPRATEQMNGTLASIMQASHTHAHTQSLTHSFTVSTATRHPLRRDSHPPCACASVDVRVDISRGRRRHVCQQERDTQTLGWARGVDRKVRREGWVQSIHPSIRPWTHQPAFQAGPQADTQADYTHLTHAPTSKLIDRPISVCAV